MIYATVNVTVGEYESVCDKLITLYRGDKNVEIRFVMHGNRFTVLDNTYAQMIIKRPSAASIFSEPALIQNDTVVFLITDDMIDELKEIGAYTFQIRLYDDNMVARVTLPPCYSTLFIEKPIAVEGESIVNLAMVNDSAVMLADTTISEEDIFTEDGQYNKTMWKDGDLITDAKLNKIEEALHYINENGGGGGGATAPYISSELPENIIVPSGNNFDLPIDYYSPNFGKGTLKVFINDVESVSKSIEQGVSTTIIDGDKFSKGTNRVVVYVIDRVGVMSNSLVFYLRYGSTEITSDFDPYSAYDYGSIIRYYFTPTSVDTSLTLSFYMSIDGTVQKPVSCKSDVRGYFTFPMNLSAGKHYCEAYVIDSENTKSNVLKFNLVILQNNTLVVVSDTADTTIEEGAQLTLDYKVYMKNNSSFITEVYVDNNLVNTGTCGLDFNEYKTSSLTEGTHSIKLVVYDVTRRYRDSIIWTVVVTASAYEMLQPVNAGAIFIGTAVNKSNADERRQYFIGHDQEGNEILGTLTNFAFNSESGWVDDELIISGNSHAEIPIQPLANNAKYGFTLDIEFTSKQIGVPDAEVLTLWNNETNCGIRITTEKLILRSSNGNQCDLYFTDNERTHVMFIIDRQELKAKIYLNGVMCEAFHLNDYTVDGVAYLDDFTVNSNIVLGGLNKNGYCKIRNLRIYQVALTTDEIINNFISCEIDKSKQRELANFQKGDDLPTLYVYCDFSGLGKDDKKPCKIVYNSTNEELYGKSFNLDHKQSQLQYQGTSSMAYPIKNYRLNLRDENGDKWYYTLPTAQPECRFTLKADFMSSGHWTNTGMAKFINDKLYNYNVNDEKSMNPFKWDHVQNGGKVTDFRETISGFPCRLILVNDGETPLNTGQNEPTPGNTKDMGIFNFNNDKDNVTTLGFNSDIFPNCASYEVTANSDTSAGAFISAENGLRPNLFSRGQFVYGTYVDDLTKGVSVNMLNDNSFEVTTSSDRRYFAGAVLSVPTEINKEYTLKAVCNVSYGASYMCLGTGKPNTGGWLKTVNTDTELGFTFTATADITDICFYALETQITENKGFGLVTYKNVRIQEAKEISEADELAYIKESFELRHPDEDDVNAEDYFIGAKKGKLDYWRQNSMYYTALMTNPGNCKVSFGDNVPIKVLYYNENNGWVANGPEGKGEVTLTDTTFPKVAFYTGTTTLWEYIIIDDVIYYSGNDLNVFDPTNASGEPRIEESTGLKHLIDWVDNCTDEEFVRDFEEHFHKDYTLRYFCLVTLIGAVDNLGKNMMLDTADNKIYFPRFYDIDTICSYDNSGQLKFDVDIEMEQGYWNTSSSRLWTRIRDLMHDDIVTTYNNMRQNGVSYENMMYYIYDEQIAKIPQTYYNKDYDVKYAPFADSYIGMAHGDTYEHVKRWLKQRFAFVDTLFDYAPSYNNDILTIRANTTELMTLEIETYTPVYLHLSWYNGQMDKKKIDGKVSVEFSGKAQTATDQEVLIYGGSNVKSIKGIQSANPNRLILGSATKLTELDASNCPLLSEINMNKANLSPHEYLNKVNLSNCPLLDGNLRLNNSPLIQELDIRGTNITGMNLPSSIRNLQVLKLPNTMVELTLNDAGMLHTLEFDEGVKMQSIAMSNCNALTNVVNFDLLQTPSITLNNSYNTAAELYFRDTTNLSLSNMSNLERVIFTPNNEYETFEMIKVANAPDYKVTTFNCPKLSTFMTTAPYRESYMVNAKYLGFILPGKTRTELEYIQSDGNQYFDTGITPETGDIIVMDLDMDKRADANYDYFIGGNVIAVQFNNTSNKGLSNRGCTISPRETATGDIPACNVSERNTYTISITANEDHTLKIFAGSYQGAFETHNKGIGKLYSFKYYSYDRLIRDYIPCKDEDGIVCLYDNINNKFLYPDGTLIAGSEADVSDKLVEVWDKGYGNIHPNTTFTANSIDISNTQFTDVKLLCTTDTNTLKLPTTVKNFYCDSSFDLDTDYLEDGEYDVVHGELVEQYTTDYEGEVVRVATEEVSIPIMDICTTNGSISGNNDFFPGGSYYVSLDYIRVVPGTPIKITFWVIILYQYDKDKKMIEQKRIYRPDNVILYSNCEYIRFQVEEPGYLIEGCDVIFSPYAEYTPNLIPSSADGSLIFSMYAPSNTVEPASGTWDLHGLEFDNFHTFGMNNDVKPSEDSLIKCYTDKIIAYHATFWGSNSGTSVTTSQKDLLMIFDKLELFGEERDFTIIASDNKVVQGGHINSGWKSGYIGQNGVTSFTWKTNADTPYLVAKVGVSDKVEWIQFNDVRIHLSNLDIREVATTSPIVEGLLEVNAPSKCNMILGNSPTSITMPARYDDYNITIKNANISPTTHNTMLYPLLVNEDNPITGTLDYTNYAGKHLSWSFAYTDEEYVNIIQPKDELINSYEYRYNAFYDTEYEFDNPYEIAMYTSSASGVLPSFNAEFTYTYDEIDNGDGTYTTKIYADSLDNLPTSISFRESTNLLTVDKLNTSEVTNMSFMFARCRLLTSLDLSGFDTSNVTKMGNMFQECRALTTLDLSGFDTSNVTVMGSMFYDCQSLKTLDVSGFDTSKVTNMAYMFSGCSNLTSLDVSGFDTSEVTTMAYIFSGCSNLTSLDVSGFDTSKVTNMEQTFAACKMLESLDLSAWDISRVTNTTWFFNECYKLASLNAMKNISRSLDLSSTKLDTESLLDIIDNLVTVTQALTLRLGSTLLAKLTEDQIAIATNKGWTIT